MKILVIVDPVVPISEYYSVGATNAACQMCIELSKMGIEVVLGGNWDDENAELSQYVTPFNIYDPDTRYYMKKAFQIVNEHLNDSHYDSINIHISTPSVAKYLLDLNNEGTPTYFTMHSWTGTTAVSYYYIEQYRELINTDKLKFVFLCNSQMQTLFDKLEMEPKNYIIEPNAILGEKYNISDDKATKFVKSILPESFIKDGYNLTVARLVRSKHPDAVIDACLRNNGKLVVIGDEWINDKDYAQEVKDRVTNNPDKIFLISKLSNKEVLMVMKKAICTVLFTDMEVCNLTIMESCMVGTPVVVGPGFTGVRDSIDNLKDGGITEIVFPKRVPWGLKLDALYKCMEEASTYRYDVSKFPECYKWENHIKNCYKIVTNTAEFK